MCDAAVRDCGKTGFNIALYVRMPALRNRMRADQLHPLMSVMVRKTAVLTWSRLFLV